MRTPVIVAITIFIVFFPIASILVIATNVYELDV